LVALCYILHTHNQNVKEPILLSVDSNKLLLNVVLVTDVLKVFNGFCTLHKECKTTMNIQYLILNFTSQAFTRVSLVMVPFCNNYSYAWWLSLFRSSLCTAQQFVVSQAVTSQVKLQVCIYFIFHIPKICRWSVLNLCHEETNLHLYML
jgi:hypothetical protein